MKIGILTYHRSHNYGALLQAIATRNIVEKCGHNVFFIDYWPEYHRRIYALFSIRKMFSLGFFRGLGYLKTVLSSYDIRKEKITKTEKFISYYISPYVKSVNEYFDAIIYGSDQIWRKQTALKNYNPVYFAHNNFHANKHVAFSASMGILPTESIDKENVKKMVTSFDAISVREIDLQRMLIQLGVKNVALTVDPTLQLSAEEWDSILGIEDVFSDTRYILFYDYMKHSFEINQIKQFAKNHNMALRILTATGVIDEFGRLLQVTDPKDFVALIKKSSMVFTSSFHGLAFAIIYKKPFYASYNRNSGRASSLLNSLEIDGCLLQPMESVPLSIPNIDYEKVQLNLNKKIVEARRFLRVHL